MSDKQDIWLSEYLRCLNATEAARRAGYKWPDKMGAHNKALFADEIKTILSQRIPSPEAIVSRVADIAFADLTDYIDKHGRIDIQLLKASGQGFLLKKYKIKKGESLEVEYYPADSALDKLMRYHSLYKDTVEHRGSIQITRIQDERPD